MKKYVTFSLLIVIFLFTHLNCKKEEIKSSAKEILTFSVAGQINESTIDALTHVITSILPNGANLTSVSPQITISEKASISPASGDATDFSAGPVTYTVTAEDGSTQTWTISITTELSTAAYILSFSVAEQIEDPIITNSSVSVLVDRTTNLSSLTPTIVVSPGATINPASGSSVDFSTDTVLYTVTSEAGTTRIYSVSVTKKLSDENSILTISIPNQIGEAIFEGKTITLELPDSSDLTAVIPSITFSPYATISPEDSLPYNFSKTYVPFRVTSESGKIALWKVYVRYYLVKPNDPKIKYTGRIDYKNPLKPRFYAPGVYINAKFTGTYCQVILNDEGIHNYVYIKVDDQEPQKIQLMETNNTIMAAEGLADGEHTLMICKNTESNTGYIDFVGLRCEGIVEADPLPARKIEFYGNSITAGTDSDVSEYPCDDSHWHEKHNAYYSYGPKTARNLNAQWMLSAYSGIGLIHSCCNLANTMPVVYNKVNMAGNKTDWDFSLYTPDVVTLCLGQNDGIQDSTDFCSAYVDFINTLRGKYPNTNIVLITSPMADATLRNALKNYITGVVNYMNNDGDAKVSYYFFSTSWNSGCGTHPSMDEHTDIANELTAYLQTLMGW